MDTSSDAPLPPQQLAARLAEVYVAIGPVYRKVARIVERSEPVMGMSVGVRSVLELLARRRELTVPQMARAQELSRQFVQRMVNDAVSAGFVELAANPAHKRSSLVRLTEAGRTAIGAVTARELALMSRVGGDLTGRELESTLRVLHHMLDGLEDVEQSELRGERAGRSRSAAPAADDAR